MSADNEFMSSSQISTLLRQVLIENKCYKEAIKSFENDIEIKISCKKKGNLTSFGLSVICLAMLLQDIVMAE